MPEKQLHSNDEIDLLELFMVLWTGKWLIAGITLLAAVLGFIYIVLTPNDFETKLNIKSLATQTIDDYFALNSIIATDLENTARTGRFVANYTSDRQPFFKVTELYLANAFYRILVNEPLNEILGPTPKNLSENIPEEDYWNAIKEASSNFVASIDDSGLITITFQGRNEASAKQLLETALKVTQTNTKSFVLEDFKNHSLKYSARKKVILEELSIEKSLATADFSKTIEYEIERLKEHLEIASALGIEDAFENGFANQAFGNTEHYFKGRKVLEAEIAMLERRQPTETHLPVLQRINSAMTLIEADSTVEFAQNALQETPLGDNKIFKAVNYNTDQMQYTYKKRPTLILALSLVLGGFLGMATVLLRNAVKSRKPFDP